MWWICSGATSIMHMCVCGWNCNANLLFVLRMSFRFITYSCLVIFFLIICTFSSSGDGGGNGGVPSSHGWSFAHDTKHGSMCGGTNATHRFGFSHTFAVIHCHPFSQHFFFCVSLSFFPFCSSSQCCRMSHVLIYNLVAIHVVTFHPHRASTTHTETQASGVFLFACAVCICIIPLLTLCIRSWCTSCATAFYSFYTPPLIPWSFEQKFMSCLFYL